MRVNKFLVTMALSCGLMALPSLAQTSTSSTDQQTPSAAQSGTMSDQSSASQQGSMGTSSATDASSIQSNIQDALTKDTQLAGQSVNARVNSKNQIVLSGSVRSQAEKDRAEQVATQTAGSSYTVKNHIKVSGKAGSAGSMSAQPPQK